eukprot:TRINITY_DN3479_c0_g3_i1.p1 TRINITY_DN3479_c0_g3~~TRINITY_DN3479_c0_g3_i1.p1  ORF type:complete len:1094 (+),score=208.84 TRINITY_DN3479_c0_g3_i1:6-3287(+)
MQTASPSTPSSSTSSVLPPRLQSSTLGSLMPLITPTHNPALVDADGLANSPPLYYYYPPDEDVHYKIHSLISHDVLVCPMSLTASQWRDYSQFINLLSNDLHKVDQLAFLDALLVKRKTIYSPLQELQRHLGIYNQAVQILKKPKKPKKGKRRENRQLVRRVSAPPDAPSTHPLPSLHSPANSTTPSSSSSSSTYKSTSSLSSSTSSISSKSTSSSSSISTSSTSLSKSTSSIRPSPHVERPSKDDQASLRSLDHGAGSVAAGRVRAPAATLHPNVVLIRKVIITPTRAYLVGPDPEQANRVIREFRAYSSYFLRVVFSDENQHGIKSAGAGNLLDRVLSFLRRPQGSHAGGGGGGAGGEKISPLFILGRRYEFLAYSTSQLKEHSCWFVSPFRREDGQEMTADKVRSWMGNFSVIKIPAKAAASMGQCFSSTVGTDEVPPECVLRIPDIKSKDGHYTFSDGVGLISKSFAQKILPRLEFHHPNKALPSAFQIRFGGFKGVVAVSSDLPDDYRLALRPSMDKFPCDHNTFEVIGDTRYMSFYLNRQIITILSALGIKDEIFIQMQRDMLKDLDVMLTDTKEAMRFLSMHGANNSPLYNALRNGLDWGFDVKEEPFIQSFMQAIRRRHIRDLTKKSRVFVQKGVVLMGIMDESGTLGPNELFIRYIDPLTNAPVLRTGVVLLSKMPAFLTGDMRLMDAVASSHPFLKDKIDCIIFSQHGDRPVPNMCSGSDLDGDLYHILWDERLMPAETSEPGFYGAPDPVRSLPHADQRDEIVQFFVNFMKNDILPTVALNHLAWADQLPAGARSEECIQLAELHSIAVDFPKTGRPAKLSNKLQPAYFPDFMEKKRRVSYESKRAIGVMYREAKGASDPEDVHVKFDADMMVEGYQDYIEEALAMQTFYNSRLHGIMNQFGIYDEAQLLSGHVVKFMKIHKRSHYEVAHRAMEQARTLHHDFRNMFFEGLHDGDGGGKEGGQQQQQKTERNEGDDGGGGTGSEAGGSSSSSVDDKEDEIIKERQRVSVEDRKAAAWYRVAYHPDYTKEKEEEKAKAMAKMKAQDYDYDDDNYGSRRRRRLILSFPWVVGDILTRIKNYAFE